MDPHSTGRTPASDPAQQQYPSEQLQQLDDQELRRLQMEQQQQYFQMGDQQQVFPEQQQQQPMQTADEMQSQEPPPPQHMQEYSQDQIYDQQQPTDVQTQQLQFQQQQQQQHLEQQQLKQQQQQLEQLSLEQYGLREQVSETPTLQDQAPAAMPVPVSHLPSSTQPTPQSPTPPRPQIPVVVQQTHPQQTYVNQPSPTPGPMLPSSSPHLSRKAGVNGLMERMVSSGSIKRPSSIHSNSSYGPMSPVGSTTSLSSTLQDDTFSNNPEDYDIRQPIGLCQHHF